MRFVIFAHFSPSIPPRGVVAISSLFHFRRREIFAFALVGDIYPSYDQHCSLWDLHPGTRSDVAASRKPIDQ